MPGLKHIIIHQEKAIRFEKLNLNTLRKLETLTYDLKHLEPKNGIRWIRFPQESYVSWSPAFKSIQLNYNN